MNLKIKLFDTSLPLPQAQTAGAAGLDLYVRLETTIEPKSIGYIPLNVAVEIPEGYWGMLAARSSTHKAGLMLANGVGVVDQDFCGDTDEYRFIAYNFTELPVTVARGQRIAQLVLMPHIAAVVQQVSTLANPDRGGIGSTG